MNPSRKYNEAQVEVVLHDSSLHKVLLMNKGEMSPKPSVLRFLNSEMINTHSDLRFEMSNLN